MILKILLTGDVNLMNVTDPAGPFAQVAAEFKSADLVFSNLECCFYEPDAAHALDREGFFAPLASAEALKIAGIDAVGIANNVNYGTAPILSSIARLDQLGIPHTGAGATLQKAREPAVLEWQGRRIGMLQRTSVFWTTDHEAADNAVGVATIRGHTAYQVPMFRAGPGAIPLNRPGVPPAIVTWADPPSLQRFRDDVAALKARCEREADLLRSRQLLLSYRARRHQTRRLGRHAREIDLRRHRCEKGRVSIHPPQRRQRDHALPTEERSRSLRSGFRRHREARQQAHAGRRRGRHRAAHLKRRVGRCADIFSTRAHP